MKNIYDIEARDINGKIVLLNEYRDRVMLIVNVASRCGFTPQYEGLEKIYRKYKDRGFVLLGFPANDFLHQEPGTEEEIKQFCTLNFGVTFPMFSKITVKGKEMHPLYRYLTSKESNPRFGGKIKWNFNKFLIGKNGDILARFDSAVKPESRELTSAIEKALL
ncbi:MAG: glutathione peroxidase [Spirochaetales bacterium]|nr:glutathione peroxidase [Spirochaetales bacterium]